MRRTVNWRRAGTQIFSAAGTTGLFFAYSVSLLLAPARWMTAPSFRPPSRVKGPSFCSESGCQITKRGNQKNFHFTQDLVWIAVRKTASPKGQGADSHMISVETSQLSCSSFLKKKNNRSSVICVYRKFWEKKGFKKQTEKFIFSDKTVITRKKLKIVLSPNEKEVFV